MNWEEEESRQIGIVVVVADILLLIVDAAEQLRSDTRPKTKKMVKNMKITKFLVLIVCSLKGAKGASAGCKPSTVPISP